jgi:hypothetical protein
MKTRHLTETNIGIHFFLILSSFALSGCNNEKCSINSDTSVSFRHGTESRKKRWADFLLAPFSFTFKRQYVEKKEFWIKQARRQAFINGRKTVQMA